MKSIHTNLAVFLRRFWEKLAKDPRLSVRIVLGMLLLANLAAAAMLFHPWSGSPDELQQQLVQLRREVQQREAAVQRLETLVSTVEKTRVDSGQFFSQYFLAGQTAYSPVLDEIRTLADGAGVKAKDHSFDVEPIEGSETLSMMNITGNYEGTYADLIQFVNAIDRSPRFLTIERLQAAPLQSQGLLNINLRINAFVRGEAEGR